MATEPVPKPSRRRRWFQFSLRFLFVAVTVVCVLIGMEARKYQRQKSALDELLARGATVRYDYEIDDRGYLRRAPDANRPSAPRWMQRAFGEHYFYQVIGVGLFGKHWNDADTQLLIDLPWLRGLSFHDTTVTDKGFQNVSRCACLEQVTLVGRHPLVTDASILQMRQLRKLKFVDLSGSRATERGLRELHRKCNCEIWHAELGINWKKQKEKEPD